jgi:hypothetical protein
VWRSSLGNLVTGHDARKPFVDAFADEQLLGFTKVRLHAAQSEGARLGFYWVFSELLLLLLGFTVRLRVHGWGFRGLEVRAERQG